MENPQPAGATPGRFGSFKQDLPASVVVFLVALPLCMGIAIASGVPPEKAAAVGIITGIGGSRRRSRFATHWTPTKGRV